MKFETLPLGQVTNNFDTKRVPIKESERRKGEYPYYGASGIVDHVQDYIFDGDYLLIAEDGENLRTRQTPIAFRAQGKFWVNNHAHIVTGNEKALTRYLEYAVNLADINSYLSGSTMPKLTQGNLNRLPVVIPPIDIQKKIVKIIGSIDDKIELNNKMNETLESMAKVIFKEWFIDFGPVKAKAERRKTFGMDDDTAALFSNCFEKSELGMIPQGWQVGQINDLFTLQRGFDLPATQRTAGLYPVMAASGPSGTHNEFKVHGPGVTTGRSGLLGGVYYVKEDFWPLNTSLWIKEYKNSTPLHAYHVLRGLDYSSLNVGSAVPSLNRNHVHSIAICVPPREVISAFERHILQYEKLKSSLRSETIILSKARDLLLPKVISGELQLSEVSID